jgi:hypothetical protein
VHGRQQRGISVHWVAVQRCLMGTVLAGLTARTATDERRRDRDSRRLLALPAPVPESLSER